MLCISLKLCSLHIFVLLWKEFAAFDPNTIIIANLRRRESIPINQIGYQYNNDDLNYRKTKNIRESVYSRRGQTESHLREGKPEKEDVDALFNKLRWLTINTDEGLGIGI